MKKSAITSKTTQYKRKMIHDLENNYEIMGLKIYE